MQSPVSIPPYIVQRGIEPSFAAIMLLVALSVLIFGVGYYLRQRGQLNSRRISLLWAAAAILPLLIALYWGYFG